MEEEFPPRFDDQIRQKSVKKDPACTPELFSLACGPNTIARSFTACLVNGVRFLVHERDIHRTTQNSGVSTHPGNMEKCIMASSKKFWSSLISATARLSCSDDAYRNQQYILATQARQVFYLEDPARRPLHWKVVEEVHHRKNFLRDIVEEDDQDVIHGGTSSDVALSNEFPDLDDTDAHDIGSDDEVDPTDDEFAEVGPACIDVMALSVAPSYHGGDAGDDPPERPNRLLPHQCEGSGQRGPTTLQALKTAYKKNNNKRLDVGFDYKDQKTFRPVGGFSSNLVSLIGNLVKNLPLDYDTWEQIPETARVSILPELKTDKTVGSMVELGLLQSMKKQFRHFKNRIKDEYFSKFESVKEAKRKMPPEDDWKKGQAAWEKQVDWWADPKRVEKAAKNAENRAKKRTATYQGSKSFAQGRHEYARMKSIKDQVNARTIEFKSDKEIIAEVTKSTNREHESGVGRRLPVGTGSSSRISPEPNQDYCTREQITEIIRQEVADKERWKKAAEEAKQEAELAKQEAELAKQEAKLANERAARVELVLDKFMGHYNQQQTQAGVMNPGSSRIPNDDEDGDDHDGNDEDGNANNEDGNCSDES
ncbi:hypothetical protein Tco_0860851 [Tanacetum coccineum]|uniref:Uncharacterized protein n=1 Tax=Tanacetum coccineum TaxID=301880 RepID=A0ABQ5BLT5_9ASTR